MNTVYQGDCLEVMKLIPDHSVDMILADLPYGTTKCKWDVIIPFELLWPEYLRIAKHKAPIILTAKQPFTSVVVMSNLKDFRYELIWEKDKGTDFGHANHKPLNAHESMLVFFRKQPTYNKQMTIGKPYVKVNGQNQDKDDLNFNTDNSGTWVNEGFRTPKSVLKIARDNIHAGTSLHPTQKPVKLFEWLLRSYTNEGDLVLDNTAGVLTTAVACENTNRQYIVIEKEAEYIQKGILRLTKEYKLYV